RPYQGDPGGDGRCHRRPDGAAGPADRGLREAPPPPAGDDRDRPRGRTVPSAGRRDRPGRAAGRRTRRRARPPVLNPPPIPRREEDTMRGRRTVAALAAAAGLAGLAGCTTSTDSDVVNRNISQDADNFKVPRRIVFINGITDKYLLTVEGYCSVDTGNPAALTVTCAKDGGYIRDYLGRSDNVTWTVEQLDAAKVSPNYYKITFK